MYTARRNSWLFGGISYASTLICVSILVGVVCLAVIGLPSKAWADPSIKYTIEVNDVEITDLEIESSIAAGTLVEEILSRANLSIYNSKTGEPYDGYPDIVDLGGLYNLGEIDEPMTVKVDIQIKKDDPSAGKAHFWVTIIKDSGGSGGDNETDPPDPPKPPDPPDPPDPPNPPDPPDPKDPDKPDKPEKDPPNPPPPPSGGNDTPKTPPAGGTGSTDYSVPVTTSGNEGVYWDYGYYIDGSADRGSSQGSNASANAAKKDTDVVLGQSAMELIKESASAISPPAPAVFVESQKSLFGKIIEHIDENGTEGWVSFSIYAATMVGVIPALIVTIAADVHVLNWYQRQQSRGRNRREHVQA